MIGYWKYDEDLLDEAAEECRQVALEALRDGEDAPPSDDEVYDFFAAMLSVYLGEAFAIAAATKHPETNLCDAVQDTVRVYYEDNQEALDRMVRGQHN